jgi:hypothetical protein
MRVTGFMLVLVLLAGCGPSTITDQCLRKELFSKCMDVSPDDPGSAVYKSHEELLTYCANASLSRSSKPPEQVKPACSAS